MITPLITTNGKPSGLVSTYGTTSPLAKIYLNDVLIGSTAKIEISILEIYGKTIRASAGTPSKDNPIALISVGDTGSLLIDVNDGASTITVPLDIALGSLPNGVYDTLTPTTFDINVMGSLLNYNYFAGDWWPTVVWGGLPGMPTVHAEGSSILCSHTPDGSSIMGWANSETLSIDGSAFGFADYATFITWAEAQGNNGMVAMWQLPEAYTGEYPSEFPKIPVVFPETRLVCETDILLEL